jgi:hypothetical protein
MVEKLYLHPSMEEEAAEPRVEYIYLLRDRDFFLAHTNSLLRLRLFYPHVQKNERATVIDRKSAVYAFT